VRTRWAVVIVAMIGAAVVPRGALAAIEISTDPTSNMICSAGTCTSTAMDAVLNVNDLQTMLAGSDVAIRTANGAVTIQIKAPLTWASPTRLTLDANLNVSVKARVAVAGTAAGLTIVTNDGGTGGDLIFTDTGSVSFWDVNSSLSINGTAYTLVKTLDRLAHAVSANPAGAYALAQNYDARQSNGRIPVQTELAGQFEGLGNEIANLVINIHGKAATCGGLFASGAATSVVRDIRLSNLNMDALAKNWSQVGMGGIEGCGEGTIINASVDGTVKCGARKKAHDVGLIAGEAGTILRSQASGTVYGVDGRVGGLAGYAANIVSSHANVTIILSHSPSTGGLAGEAGTVSLSYASGSITPSRVAGGLSAGGLIGRLTGNNPGIDQSYSTVDVRTKGGAIAGGLAGEGSNITNSYALGSVTVERSSSAGGLVGEGSKVQSSFAAGLVGNQDPNGSLGGFIGKDFGGSGSMTDDYWDLDTSGVSNPSRGAGNVKNDDGITGLTDNALKSELPAGFDPAIWGRKKKINNGYPYLLANPPPK